ncbi:VWA domain-containing protein [Mycobacterium sp.]|uniref:VWA domain-containing protein n=1 Tax=Mycobacterium sp. TaxID=1785 RepID=UPI0025F4CF97|nr:VWA domain-containing protein [Mycobacterium sp.]MBW0014582.1 VWA domain-containing protein [Mycobacterium sp.]
MTFDPIVPAGWLLAIATVLIVIRVAALTRVLAGAGSGRLLRVLLRWSALTAAGLLLVLAAARPGLLRDDLHGAAAAGGSARAAAANVFFVVDRSVDGRVTDYGSNAGNSRSRMSGIRDDIAALVDQYPGARFAVISFAATASLDWPLSDDAWSLEPLVRGMSTYTEVPPDAMFQVNAEAANGLLRAKLAEASEAYPGSKNLVFYFGEGAGGSRAAQGGLDIPHSSIAGGAVLGYGTPAGGPVPQALLNGNVVYEWDEAANRAANSGLDEDALRGIAGVLGVPYFHRDNVSGGSIARVMPAVDLTASAARDSSAYSHSGSTGIERTELYWVLSGLAALLALGESYPTLRDIRRNRPPRRVESADAAT